MAYVVLDALLYGLFQLPSITLQLPKHPHVGYVPLPDVIGALICSKYYSLKSCEFLLKKLVVSLYLLQFEPELCQLFRQRLNLAICVHKYAKSVVCFFHPLYDAAM